LRELLPGLLECGTLYGANSSHEKGEVEYVNSKYRTKWSDAQS